jgi:hypothetical protein
MEEQSNTTPAVVNGAVRRYNLPGTNGRLLAGNPGRPRGSKNKSTLVREWLASSVNRDTVRIFRQHLRRPSSKSEFNKAMDQLIAILGPSKPFSVDQSKHTHFTVVVDGSTNSNGTGQ